MTTPLSSPLNGGTAPITIPTSSNRHWGGKPVTRHCLGEQRQPSQGLVKVVQGAYYGLILGMAACVVGGVGHYLSVRYEAQRIAAEQARTYNASVAEMERILWQMHRQKASADLEQRTLAKSTK